MNSEQLLTSFRQEWQRELKNTSTPREIPASQEQRQSASQSSCSFSCNSPHSGIISDVETEAADLFSKGVQLEQNGQLYESIRYYRKAISLVPDIELRVHHRNIQERVEEYLSEEEEEERLENEEHSDLVSRFESMLVANESICQPQCPQDAPHLSCLPAEMLEKILCWVIGIELDFESFEKVASVCRGLFLVCRKQDFWRKACFRVWGINTGDLNSYGTWREMFIYRPRPRFNGCYISKTTYFRSGENSFQDLSYQPWHIVCYYRYLRFFPHGHVLMLTTSEEPQGVVGHLKKHESKHPQEMEVKPVRGRPHWQLAWRCYSVVSAYQNGSHTTSVVNVADQSNFPPLSFSKVKSYMSDAEAPLF